MEQRRSGRVIVELPVELAFNDRKCPGRIENLSPEGAYIIAKPTEPAAAFTPGSPVDLRFQFPSGEKVHLQCRIKWSYPTPPHGYTHNVGVEIIEPPAAYSDALQALTT